MPFASSLLTFMKNCNTADPILDTGAPRSVGGLASAQELAARTQQPLKLSVLPVSKRFMHGWGPQAQGASMTKFSWKLNVVDNEGNPFTLEFLLTESEDPLIVGRDILSTSNLDNAAGIVHFVDHESGSKHALHSYEANDATGNTRQFLDVGGLRKLATALLSVQDGATVGISERLQRMSPKTFATRLHHYGHLIAAEMKTIAS